MWLNVIKIKLDQETWIVPDSFVSKLGSLSSIKISPLCINNGSVRPAYGSCNGVYDICSP